MMVATITKHYVDPDGDEFWTRSWWLAIANKGGFPILLFPVWFWLYFDKPPLRAGGG